MMLFITSIVPIVISNDMNSKNIDNKQKNSIGDSEEKCSICGVYGKNMKGIFSSYCENSPSIELMASDEQYPMSKIIETPEYFNWKDYQGKDWTTPAKDQAQPKYCGGCWNFAAIGALESVINIMEGNAELDPDLSEQYVLSCLPRAGSCSGGDPPTVFKYILDN